MDYRYKVIISGHNVYKEFDIPSDMNMVRIGTTTQCEFRLDADAFFETIELEMEKREVWSVNCKESLYFSRGDMRKLLSTELLHGDMISVKYAQSGEVAFSLRFMIDFEAVTPKYDCFVDLSNKNQVRISDMQIADFVLRSAFSLNTDVVIQREGNYLTITEFHSTYGVYQNGMRLTGKKILDNYTFISIADYSFYYKKGRLYFDGSKVVTNNMVVTKLSAIDDPKYPMFVRNTRIKGQIDTEAIHVLDPAAIPSKDEKNIILSLLPAAVMLVLVILLRGVFASSKTGMGSSYILFSVASMGIGLITSVAGIVENKKKYKKDCANRITTYMEYAEKKKEEITSERQRELELLRESYYSTEQDLEHVEQFDSRLFDRVPEDEDFLDVYLGIGTTLAKKEIDYKPQETLESGDEIMMIPGQLAETFKYITDAPIYVHLKEANAIGVVGSEENRYKIFKNMLIDLMTRQYYGDVHVYALLDEDYSKYDWIRLLPHLNNGYYRNIVCDSESKNNIFENLFKELTARSETKAGLPGFNVVFVMGEHGIKSHPISKFIETASMLNTVFIFFEAEEKLLPLHCSSIIHTEEDESAVIYESANKSLCQNFRFANIPDARLKNAITILAPVFCEEISLEGSLRKSISLFELLGIYSVEDLNLTARWKASKIYDTMAVPLGVNVKDDIVYLDLHEKYHGPHGLVAGTTGSGKSEILQTYILGAATLFHPYEIGFVIIDFKGGGMVNQFKDLPHLIGAITNIDGKAIDRSLKSIKAELLKRQNLFAEAEVNHIDKYIKAYKEGKVKTALPHLVIIVDEFAELKAEQPEFMKELISAARIGRSLGVHLILATQKPAGQVNEQIWSNSKFKLCLKVQTKEDSNEVLKSPLAAEIREPGRAYLQVGNNELFELLQSGFSGAPEKSDDSKTKAIELHSLDFKGNRKIIFKQKPQKSKSARNQLEAIVDYVKEYCEKLNIASLPEICLPALSEVITYDASKYSCKKDLEVTNAIGIYDDPDNQYQGLATLSLATQNTLIIGSTQYGKTNLLEVLIRNIAETYSPDDVSIYILDFGSMVLKNFEKLCHVGGVVCASDDEKLKNLFKYLMDQVAYRRERLLAAGVSSFNSYREAGHSDMPQIMVFIDNLTAMKELYLADNDFLLGLCREGLSVGISFIVANSQTTGLGYKYLSNFSNRISLFCNEVSEYTNIFGTCRMRPDETPGRGLIEIDKTIFECQTFLAFEGEKEFERVQAMQEMIAEINAKNPGKHAVPIPEIPEVLTEDYMVSNFARMAGAAKLLLGLSYETVSPVPVDIVKTNMLSVVGREDAGKSNFIKYLVRSVARGREAVDLYIFDDYKRKLQSLEELGRETVYEIGTDSCKDVFAELNAYFVARYQDMVNGTPLDDTWKIIVLNNEDAIAAVSADKDAAAAFKDMTGKYKMLNVFVILGNIPNAPIAYGAPDIYKVVKENRNILFFDDLANLKMVDVPLAVVRNNKKKIELGDGFFLFGNECVKVKTPLVEI